MDRYYPVDLTIPAGTAITNPLTIAVPLEDNQLVDIEVIIPSGHQALTGVRVLESQQQVLPWGNNSWIKGDNYVRVFDVNHAIGASAITVQGYNTDVYPHTFYLRLHMQDIVITSGSSGSAGLAVLGGTVGVGGTGGALPVIPPAPVIPQPPTIPAPPAPPAVPGQPGAGGSGAIHVHQQWMFSDM